MGKAAALPYHYKVKNDTPDAAKNFFASLRLCVNLVSGLFQFSKKPPMIALGMQNTENNHAIIFDPVKIL
ncbi:MAG TPA: hypothetical protein VGO57_12045 [Verrucomicrobiae bacterium]|jgi:hypothetical protein